MAKLIEHLEAHLGLIQAGYRDDESAPERVQVVSFGPDVPFAGATTLTTLGLSRHHLSLPNGNHVHQELLMHVTGGDEGWVPGVLWNIAGRMVENRWAMPHGQVITTGPLFPDATVAGLVAISPLWLPEEFAVCRNFQQDVPAVMVWLAPLTADEAAFATEHGWKALEPIFVAHDPDLSDLRRDGVPLSSASDDQ